MATDTYYSRSFSSFSGADIKATFAGVEIGTLQAISYAIQREKAPIFVLGRPNPRAFSRGKRGIAGTMVFVMFDDHALLGIFEENRPELIKFVKDRNELTPAIAAGDGDTGFGDGILGDDDPSNIWDDWELASAFYVDQIPPFDVTVAGVNELGAAAVLRIWGCEMLNEGYGISIDDSVSEMQTTYVARAISRWKRHTRGGGEDDFPFAAVREGGGVQIQQAT